ncbi:chemotaxis protein CheB [Pontibacter qinzhouensis]|uniref:protein-glutamate methylesterase n=1 Tax=Pontibacter qinzhouensis TaxID=2603253 RepID=A0A5C8J0V9_9BACT|nr:chemotaxis protein CheB [Pontibacter qinzhouensis]TXK27118.1 chemotaxis protein CheB [Pontibacter qinzhouensis]
MKEGNQTKQLKLIVASSSSYARLVLEQIMQEQIDLNLAGLATNGDELLQLTKVQRPDVVLLDYDLQKNSRLFALKRIFGEVPTPVLLLVTREQFTLALVKQATELGVYAVIVKPGAGQYPNYRSMAAEVLLKIRAVRESEYMNPTARLHMLEQEVTSVFAENRQAKKPETAATVIVIGASTGGTQAIETLIKHLKPELKACLLIAIHLPQRFTRSFAKRLQLLTPLAVLEGKKGLPLKNGKIIIAPGGRNMVVEPTVKSSSKLTIGFAADSSSFDLPSVDMLMKSVAACQLPRVVGVILTGMGKDGTLGAASLKKGSGIVLAQNEESSAIFGMAKSAIDSGLIDEVLSLEEIAEFINAYAENRYEVSGTDSIT